MAGTRNERGEQDGDPLRRTACKAHMLSIIMFDDKGPSLTLRMLYKQLPKMKKIDIHSIQWHNETTSMCLSPQIQSHRLEIANLLFRA